MNNLAAKLKILFPDIQFKPRERCAPGELPDCVLEKDKIVEWNLDAPQPTEEELNNVDETKEVELIQVIASRRKEYPTIEEIIHAQLDGGIDEIQARRQAVKAKYPKPE